GGRQFGQGHEAEGRAQRLQHRSVGYPAWPQCDCRDGWPHGAVYLEAVVRGVTPEAQVTLNAPVWKARTLQGENRRQIDDSAYDADGGMPSEFEIGPEVRAFRGDDDQIIGQHSRKGFERSLVPGDYVACHVEFGVACGEEYPVFEDLLLLACGGYGDVIDIAGGRLRLVSVVRYQCRAVAS